jgi:hypothetical protein
MLPDFGLLAISIIVGAAVGTVVFVSRAKRNPIRKTMKDRKQFDRQQAYFGAMLGGLIGVPTSVALALMNYLTG